MKHFSLPRWSGRTVYPDDVRMRLLTMLYENLYTSSFVILFNASLFVYVLWPVTEHTYLISWYAALSIVTLLRFLDTLSFFRQRMHDYRRWYRRMFSGVLLSAVLWGMVPIFFFPEGAPTYHLFIIVIIAGMSAGAISTLAADLTLKLLA